MVRAERIRGYNQATVGTICERGNASINLTGLTHGYRSQLDPKGRRDGLDSPQLADAGGKGSISKDRCARDVGCNLLEQREPFAAEAVFEDGEPSGVGTRSREVRNKAPTYWVNDRREYKSEQCCSLAVRRPQRGW